MTSESRDPEQMAGREADGWERSQLKWPSKLMRPSRINPTTWRAPITA